MNRKRRAHLPVFCLLYLSLIGQVAGVDVPERKSPAAKPSPTPESHLSIKIQPRAPLISGITPNDCLNAGDSFHIVGKGFGNSSDTWRAVVATGIRPIELKIIRWTDRSLFVTLPHDNRLLQGQRYSVGLVEQESTHWVSNRNHSILLCKAAKSTLLPDNQSDTAQPNPAPSHESDQPKLESGGSLFGQPLSAPPRHGGFVAADAEDREPHEILVLSVDMSQAKTMLGTAQTLGLTVKRRQILSGLGLVVTTLRVPNGITPEDAVRQLRAEAPDLWVDLNHRLKLQGEPNDPRSYPQRMIDWPNDADSCGLGVRLGMADGPLPKSHAVLAGAWIERKSFVTQGVEKSPPDHALAVAALLIGRNGRGLMPAAELFNAEVMRQRDDDNIDTTVDWLVQGLDWLVQKRVDLINLSLGGPRNLILKAAIDRVFKQGIAVVAAAGNEGPRAPPVWPAAHMSVVAVTAVDAERRLYRHANQGDYIRFAAPGVDIWAPTIKGDAYLSGTSFAAPYVTALLAQKRQLEPERSWHYHFDTLARSAQDLGQPGRDPLFGFGLPMTTTDCKHP